MPYWISIWLKHKFLKKKSSKIFNKKIYINRNDTNSDLRKIINENELLDLLKRKGFSSIKLSKLNFKDEIKIFNNAKIVIGLQGAGLTNLIWCGQHAKIVEIRSKYTNKLYENLSKQNKVKFCKIISSPLERAIKKNSVSGTLNVNIKKIEKIL